MKTALITGANAGLGKECARQLAAVDGIEKIYLGCRNPARAAAAKLDLESETGKKIFEVVLIDTTDLQSVRKAVDTVDPIDALVMNAGGNFDITPTSDGVSLSFAVNVLGHVLLTESLLEEGKLSGSVVYVSTEGVRGVPEMGFPRVEMKESSLEEFKTVADGTFFAQSKDPKADAYGVVKYMGTLWVSAMARQHPTIRFVSMSPGLSAGTNAQDNLSKGQRIVFKIMTKVLALFGKSHTAKEGAKRFVDALTDHNTYESGIFYASKKGVSGPVSDQAERFSDLKDTKIQDNANEAIHYFLSKPMRD